MESEAYCGSTVHNVYQLDRDKKTVDGSLLNAKMQFCCNCLTLSERKISTSTSPLDTKSIFNLLSLTADSGVVSSLLTLSHTFVEFDNEIDSQQLSQIAFFTYFVYRQRCKKISKHIKRNFSS